MAANGVDKHVGARVRLRRLAVGLSQTQLAQALKVSAQEMQSYEDGAARIGVERLRRLARLLDVRPSFFFDGARWATARSPNFGDEAEAPDILALLFSGESLHLNVLFSGVRDPEMRSHIVKTVERMIEVWRLPAETDACVTWRSPLSGTEPHV